MAAVIGGLLGTLALFAAPAAQAQAQKWPTRPVKFIIPFGPGAGADIGARLIQDKLSKRWGQPVIIENKPGGDSMIAIMAVLNANDDHTFMFGPSGNFTAHPYLYKKLPYDPNGLIPIAKYSTTILALGAPASENFKDLKDWVARARAANGKFNAAAVPGITEFAFDYFTHKAGVRVAKIPYKDIVQSATDLGQDRLQSVASSYAILRPGQIGGRVKVLAVMSHQRVSILPDIPSAAEAGFPALEMEGLAGLFGTKAVPEALREKIGADVVAVSTDKEIERKLGLTGQLLTPGGAKDFADAIAKQKAHVAQIAKELNIQPTR
jgi:tripartite-type tricarboxylate transporter receptor subunit TctC